MDQTKLAVRKMNTHKHEHRCGQGCKPVAAMTRLSAILLTAVCLMLALTGCGGKAEGGGVQAGEPGVKEPADIQVKFPKTYTAEAENIRFDCAVTAGPNEAGAPLRVYTATATLKKVNHDRGFDLLYSNVTDYDTYAYTEENECGESVETATYVNQAETMFSFGPKSSQLAYSRRDLLPYVQGAFRLDESEADYNAARYSLDGQLGFKDRETVCCEISDLLEDINAGDDYEYKVYALDHQTMRQEEYHGGIDGGEDRSQYKPGWSEADDCYYAALRQRLEGIPVYHVYAGLFPALSDSNAPVSVLVSANGVESLGIEMIFEFSDLVQIPSLAEFEDIAQAVTQKYGNILGGGTYFFKSAELNYYVDLNSGKGTYSVRPCWIFKGTESSGGAEKPVQLSLDAATCEEIVP